MQQDEPIKVPAEPIQEPVKAPAPARNDGMLLKKAQFAFTVITAIAAAVWGYYINAGQMRSNELQAQMQQQQFELRRIQDDWQNKFRAGQDEFQRKQTIWQNDFQQQQLVSQQEISKKVAALSAIQAMNPFFDKVAEPNIGKARMAAYAIYLLNKEDPEMAVSLIVASKRNELFDILTDIGNRDPKIMDCVVKHLPKDGSSATGQTQSDAQLNQVIQTIQTATTGYCMFGKPADDKWTKVSGANVKDLTSAPKVGKEYDIARPVYLRSSVPIASGTDLVLGQVVRLNVPTEKVLVKDVKTLPDGTVWCLVEVTKMKKKTNM